MKLKKLFLCSLLALSLGIASINNNAQASSSRYTLPKKMYHMYKGSNMYYKLTRHYGYIGYIGNKSVRTKIFAPKHGIYKSNYSNISFKYVNHNTIQLHYGKKKIYMHVSNKHIKKNHINSPKGSDLLNNVYSNRDRQSSDNDNNSDSNSTYDNIGDSNASANDGNSDLSSDDNQSLSNGSNYDRESDEANPAYDWNDSAALAQYVFTDINGSIRQPNNLKELELDNNLSEIAYQRAREISNNFSLSNKYNEAITEVPVYKYSDPQVVSGEAENMLKDKNHNPNVISNLLSTDINAMGVGCYYKNGEVYTSVIVSR
ncbi:hypothetical protein DY120_00720 [Apilactobacillus micheneri]|uniref:SCP domain-containing protein n=1 Tax=Apilactobacillus micheneri TaxID=1899430 RepID=A0ABY2YY73_9LACO|nr:CAP domain-containing protein [Apilactobacillus micheneri]TPR26253.1 hypothetical protein DY114_00720 [Apilactobacillus micheneri]TPR27007.1 hypothetical protein DY111_00720 [Apilactobacillus micheneri]TPR27865.1 hypothetical protein DY113_04495 [Apilactobacillus micheneri]TPR31770.1 hypothetical protein DY117_00720 [Apilactobacillus micheneri]TPR32174.1 hypothetical protein DY120_00720 [Apilactobacillus micheneri]